MPSKIVNRCSAAIAAKGWNIAFTESATAGRMCSEFALTGESGKILRGGISCYEVFVKEQILKVPHKLIEDHTPESAEVTASLARQSARLFNSKVTVAVTGLTTTGGSETPEKPVGTMFLSIITPLGTIDDRTVFKGDPESIILQTIDRAAELIVKNIENKI
ncbi:damage-inducible protein CinA [Flavobacterium album]|uniref:Damage-inducible protein CinA n=1 Tax=Flavobacterium album TaxID=2175091 RepID=A0A2S1R1W7_9FLAO|nr:CinA family protein [Flavobacterium album]AWH86576.1 damage-inducible protein CinA [Flavobacterium album]